jgi:hypothetical protein
MIGQQRGVVGDLDKAGDAQQVRTGDPFDLSPLESLIAQRDALG